MLRQRRTGDGGFTLVEVIVSITLLGVVAAGTLPLLLTGIRSATTAKLSTQAKGLAQERLELMRNLPFHVAPTNGSYIDVLDIYFRDLNQSLVTPASSSVDPCATRQYIAASKTYVCVLPTAALGPTTFAQRVETVFLDANGAVVTPRSGYDSQNPSAAAPNSSLLGVTISTTWSSGGSDKSFVMRSRIANSSSDAPLIVSKARASALRITSTVTGGDVLQFEAGIVNADGNKSNAATASGSGVAAYGSLSSGLTARGASASVSAPADQTLTGPVSEVSKDLDSSLCPRMCFGPSQVNGAINAAVSGGVPVVGVSTTATGMGTKLTGSGDAGARGFSYSNTDLTTVTSILGVSALPLVGMPAGASTDSDGDGDADGAGDAISALGYVTGASTSPTSVTSHVKAATDIVELFPTSYAQKGVVRLRLASASLTCKDGDGAGVTATWSATVEVWNGSSYSAYPVKDGAAQLPAPSSLTVHTDGTKLDKFIQSWEGRISASGIDTSTASARAANLPAVVNVLTQPTRGSVDPDSVLNITLGALSCHAEDSQ